MSLSLLGTLSLYKEGAYLMNLEPGGVLRAEIRKYRESADRSEKTFFFFFHQKNPFG